MKKLIVLLFLFSVVFGATKKNLKSDLEDCKLMVDQLDSLLIIAENVNDRVVINYPPTKHNVKITKAKEKTKRKHIKFETKTVRIEERSEMNQSLVFQIGSIFKRFTRAFMMLIGGGILTGVPLGVFLKSLFGKK